MKLTQRENRNFLFPFLARKIINQLTTFVYFPLFLKTIIRSSPVYLELLREWNFFVNFNLVGCYTGGEKSAGIQNVDRFYSWRTARSEI